MGRKQSGTKNITIIDNRKVGVFFFVIAAVIIVVNLFVRFYDIHKSADYKHVDGVVSSIDNQRHYYARKRRYKTTVSVIYSPGLFRYELTEPLNTILSLPSQVCPIRVMSSGYG